MSSLCIEQSRNNISDKSKCTEKQLRTAVGQLFARNIRAQMAKCLVVINVISRETFYKVLIQCSSQKSFYQL
jgi:hypothetical protein